MTLGALLTSWAALALVMGVAWVRQRATKNAGIVDVLWTAGLGSLGVAWAALDDGWGPRRALVGLMVGVWSVRLTVHLAQRVGSEPEDGRYAQLREELGMRVDTWMLVFFQAQALLAFLLSLTFLPATGADVPHWRLLDGLSLLIWVGAMTGEAIADRQLARWRKDPENKGKTCRAGLWRYSRHPNYFFEWLNWIAWAVLATGLPWGGFAWLSPALMLVLVLRVTGIPPTERRAIESRGDDYRRYQRTTNAFFPGPPRPEAT